MLDGLLGRGFAAKCKGLIKLTKSRIDMIKRKRKATEKFLKKDIADLLANGLDINAYGRAEGLLVELTLSSCYNFVEQSCEFVLKHLSVMQKLSGCPEECREAVSSLMLAAARFSDLPELRDLRQIFQERYGNSLECYVNQEFAANVNSRSPTLEKKVHLMQEIASEFSIMWDSKAFEQRMLKPSALAQDANGYKNDYNIPSHDKNATTKGVKRDVLLQKSPGHPKNEHRFHNAKEADVLTRDDYNLQSGLKHHRNGFKEINGSEEVILKRNSHDNPLPARQDSTAKKTDRGCWNEGCLLEPKGSGFSSQGKRVEQLDVGTKSHDSWGSAPSQRESNNNVTAGKPDPAPSHGGVHLKNNVNESFAVNHGGLSEFYGSERKVQKDETPRLKPYSNTGIPPPYVKLNSKQKNSTCEANIGSSHVDGDDIPKYPSVYDQTNGATISKRRDNSDLERQANRHARLSRQSHEKELFIQEDMPEVPASKPKSMRRRHSKSRSSHNDDSGEDTGVVTRKSRSRRRDGSRHGLQILFDDEHRQNDEEEKMIDKLLIHYSKKPSIPVPEKPRRKSKNHHAHQMDNSAREYLKNGSRGGSDETPDGVSLPPRSVSLPREQTRAEKVDKVFTRAASFQPDRSNEARHVHPKLPDYDDLAARIAALRGT